MKILFIAPYVPSRIRVRPFHLINELAKEHDVFVVALSEPGGAIHQGVDELMGMVRQLRIVPHSKFRGYCQSLLALPSRFPMCTSFCWSPTMARAVSEMISNIRFDMVHVEHLRAAHFAPPAEVLPVVFDSVDCLSNLFSQMGKSKKNPISKLVMAEETWSLKYYEPKTLRRFDRVVITSESEMQAIWKLDEGIKVDVLPNGVDTEYFAPQGVSRHPARFIFSGKMSYSPNAEAAIWFAENVFRRIKQMRSDAEFVITGSEPPVKVQKLAEEPGITVTGYVDDIRPYLDSASVAVVPMQVAVGIQNKLLEAMAMELPVIASELACRAFGDRCPGIVAADSPDEAVKGAMQLLNQPEMAAETGKNGRREVEERFSWKSSAKKLQDIYAEVIANRKATGGSHAHRAGLKLNTKQH